MAQQQNIQQPARKKTYIFIAALVAAAIIGIILVPPYLKKNSGLNRAKQAMRARKYITAEKILEEKLAAHPDVQEVKEYLLIAACYNLHTDKAMQMYNETGGDNAHWSDSTKLRIQKAMNYVNSVFYVDTLVLARVDRAELQGTAGLLKLYDTIKATNMQYKLNAEYLVADRLFDQANYADCKRICEDIVVNNKRAYSALTLLSAANRHLHLYNEALAACNMGLEINHEDVTFITQKAKAEMARSDYKKAETYLQDATALDSNSVNVLEVKALLLFFTKKKGEAEKVLAELHEREQNNAKVVYNRTFRIMHNAEPFN